MRYKIVSIYVVARDGVTLRRWRIDRDGEADRHDEVAFSILPETLVIKAPSESESSSVKEREHA